MSEDHWIVSQYAQIAAAYAEIAAMQAENSARAHRNETQAYLEQDFDRVRIELLQLAKNNMERC